MVHAEDRESETVIKRQLRGARNANLFGFICGGVVFAGFTIYSANGGPKFLPFVSGAALLIDIGMLSFMLPAGTVIIEDESVSYRSLFRWHKFGRRDVSDISVKEGHLNSLVVKARRVGLALADGGVFWLRYLDVQSSRSRLRDEDELIIQDEVIELIRDWCRANIQVPSKRWPEIGR